MCVRLWFSTSRLEGLRVLNNLWNLLILTFCFTVITVWFQLPLCVVVCTLLQLITLFVNHSLLLFGVCFPNFVKPFALYLRLTRLALPLPERLSTLSFLTVFWSHRLVNRRYA